MKADTNHRKDAAHKSKAALKAAGNRQRRKMRQHVYGVPLADLLMNEVAGLLVADGQLKAESRDDRHEIGQAIAPLVAAVLRAYRDRGTVFQIANPWKITRDR